MNEAVEFVRALGSRLAHPPSLGGVARLAQTVAGGLFILFAFTALWDAIRQANGPHPFAGLASVGLAPGMPFVMSDVLFALLMLFVAHLITGWGPAMIRAAWCVAGWTWFGFLAVTSWGILIDIFRALVQPLAAVLPSIVLAALTMVLATVSDGCGLLVIRRGWRARGEHRRHVLIPEGAPIPEAEHPERPRA